MRRRRPVVSWPPPPTPEEIRRLHPGPDPGVTHGTPVKTLAELESELLEIAIEEGLNESNPYYGGASRRKQLAYIITSRRAG